MDNKKPRLYINKTAQILNFVILATGAFRTANDYLDVQYRLLREDFISPLREGIKEYQDSLQSLKSKKRRNNNIRIYQNIRIVAPVSSERGNIHRIW